MRNARRKASRKARKRKKTARPDPGPFARIRQVDLCKLLGAHREQLRRWIERGLPRNPDKTYDLAQVLPWLKTYWLRESPAYAQDDDPDTKRWKRARADIWEMDAKEKAGAYLPVEMVETGLARYVAAVRQEIFAVVRLAPELGSRPVAEIETELRRWAEELCQRNATVPVKGLETEEEVTP